MWSQGIHARSGVSCADCHMPYRREGAMKVSDHWVRSPLLNVARSCQVCHPFPETELQARVENIQGRTACPDGTFSDGPNGPVGCCRWREKGESDRPRTSTRARVSAAGTVAARFRGSREFDGIPRSSRGRSRAGRSNRLRTARSVSRADACRRSRTKTALAARV